MDKFYVYKYLRADGTPYYIGKGCGSRKHVKANHILPKNKEQIVVVAHRLFEHEAFLLEKKLIKLYGRKDLGTGILRNMTDGGDGVSGRIVSDKQKAALAERNKNNKFGCANKGIKKSAEHCANISASRIAKGCGVGNKSRTGMKDSPEMRAKKSLAMIGNIHSLGYKHTEETKSKLRGRVPWNKGIPSTRTRNERGQFK